VRPSLLVGALGVLLSLAGARLHAQAPDGMLSEAEVDNLRDAAYVPMDRVRVYMRILNDREKELDDLMKQRHGTDFASDVHDVLDQMGSIADELNDHLDEDNSNHRDLRKVLPKLVQATERWSTSLRAPVNDERYDIVRKVALDNIKDTRDLAQQMETEQDAYFKAHPEAAKEEKERRENPHAPQ
jgi:hypothetical protein